MPPLRSSFDAALNYDLMRRFLLPILALGTAVSLDLGGFGSAVDHGLLIQVSRAVFALVFLLAWRFRRGRLAWAAVLLALVAEALRLELPEHQALRSLVLPAAAVLVPLDLALAALLRESAVLSPAGAVRFGALALQTAAVAGLGLPSLAPTATAVLAFLRRPLSTADGLPETVAPQLAWPLFGVAAIVLAVLCLRRSQAVFAGLLGALVATALALERTVFAGSVPDGPTWYLTAGGLVLGLSLIENAFSLAFEDGLTGLPARRALEETLLQLGRRYAIAMVDLDHFKRLNDRHGHEVGDQVLQMVASKLSRVRGGGRAFRYGGEEFSVLFPGRTSEEALPHLEELRRTIDGSRFTVRSPERPQRKPRGRARSGAGSGKQLRVTVSIGLAERSERLSRPQEVMKAADKALYRSKKAGRNRVTVG